MKKILGARFTRGELDKEIDCARASYLMWLNNIYFKILRKLRGKNISGSNVSPSAKVEAGSVVIQSDFGRHSFCGYDCTVINAEVGSFCSIASHVSIGGAHHPLEYVSTSPVFLSHRDSVKRKFALHEYLPSIKTIIGNDVWIGEGCFIKAGVRIGHGAVVGMGSVVTKDVPDYAIFAGNPAKLVRMRFSPAVVDGLLRLKWWDFSDLELEQIGPLIPEPEELLRQKGYL